MAFLAVDKNGDEYIYECKPLKSDMGYWVAVYIDYKDRVTDYVELPKGSIKKLIGRELTWEDECVELKEE